MIWSRCFIYFLPFFEFALLGNKLFELHLPADFRLLSTFKIKGKPFKFSCLHFMLTLICEYIFFFYAMAVHSFCYNFTLWLDDEVLLTIFFTDIHIREPEGDVLIFMTGQVSFYIFSFLLFLGCMGHFCDFYLWSIIIYLNSSCNVVLLIENFAFYTGWYREVGIKVGG